MTKYDDLIERLEDDATSRETIAYSAEGVEKCLRLMRKSTALEIEAAAALKAQQAEIERLRGVIDELRADGIQELEQQP